MNACGQCTSRISKYCCPRCRASFCCLECYKEHGSCALEFYKNEVLRERAARNRRDEQDRKVKEIVRRVRGQAHWEHSLGINTSENSDPQHPDADIGWVGDQRAQEIIKGVENGTIFDVKQLSTEEQKMFAQFLEENASELMVPWEPYWEKNDGIQSINFSIIEESGEEFAQTSLARKRKLLVERLTDLPDFSDIGIKTPVKNYSLLLNNVISVLVSISLSLRKHNGELSEDSTEEFNQLVLALATPLSLEHRRYFSNISDVIADLRQGVSKQFGFKSTEIIEGTMQDLSSILRHKLYILELLFILFDSLDRQGIEVSRSLLSSSKKVLFYISFIKGLNEDYLKEKTRELSTLIGKEQDLIKGLVLGN